MKKTIILCTFLLLSCSVSAQNSDTWIAFWDKDSTHIGFKDKNGVIKIKPKFSGYTFAQKFENIIAVTEENNNNWKSYYLTKQGKIVGRDSLYSFDNSTDCENEGFIRFKDGKADKMGMFNSQGKIAIPAIYSDLTKSRNGMVIVLKDATKRKLHKDDEHVGWTGGKEFLIDTNNTILIENFSHSNNINFYSLQKSKEPSKDETRENFLGVNGLYYSFISYDKEFKSWLKKTVLSDLSLDNLLNLSFDKITYWKEPNGWTNEPKTKFITQNCNLLKLKLQQLNDAKTEYFISSEGLNQFIFESSEYEIYFNNCNESKDWIYPVMDIVISPKNKTDRGQDHFQFLRTKNGYKLISVSTAKNDLN